MVRIELTAAEAALLAEILESSLSDLRNERMHTDKRELRQTLKERETLIDGLLKRLVA
jgi:hypothetical protein